MTEADEIYSELTEALGTLFKQYRKQEKLSMREIYRLDNISIATVSDLESGKKIPSIKTLIKLMLRLKIPMNQVFCAFDDDYGRLERLGLSGPEILFLFKVIKAVQEVRVPKNVIS